MPLATRRKSEIVNRENSRQRAMAADDRRQTVSWRPVSVERPVAGDGRDTESGGFPLGPVQAKGALPDSATVRPAAARGVAGACGPLPFLSQIQSAFGPHDVSRARATVGGVASKACKTMGAQAYATGDRVAFASRPSLRTSAHEATHIVQQRSDAGVHLPAGIGRPGDAYEKQADRVADLVVSGHSAQPELDTIASAHGDRGGPSPVVQMDTTIGKVANDVFFTPDDVDDAWKWLEDYSNNCPLATEAHVKRAKNALKMVKADDASAAKRNPIIKGVAEAFYDSGRIVITCLGLYFGLEATQEESIMQDPSVAMQVWRALESLPEAHLKNNTNFQKLILRREEAGSHDQQSASGKHLYEEDTVVIYAGADPAHLKEPSKKVDENDPLEGANRLDHVVRHETGHTMEREIGWRDSYANKTMFGGWQWTGEKSTFHNWLQADMAVPSGTFSGLKDAWTKQDERNKKLGYPEKRYGQVATEESEVYAPKPKVEDGKIVEGQYDYAEGFEDLYKENPPTEDDEARARVLRLIGAVRTTDGEERHPYTLTDKYAYVYYQDQYCRYDRSAWDNKVSRYQFSGPREFFAEFYGAFYNPSQSVHDNVWSKNPDAAQWFHSHDKLGPNPNCASPYTSSSKAA